jgi:hypothetical protein
MAEGERKAWTGSDFVTIGSVTIPPLEYGYVKVLVTSENIPGPRKVDFMGAEGSARSRNAQFHLAFTENASSFIAEQVDARGISGDRLGFNFPAQVPVRNYAPRFMQIDDGIAIGRLYIPGERIKGEELSDLLASRDIYVDGAEGKDWWKGYDGYPKNKGNIDKITVRVHPGRNGIPPYKPREKQTPVLLSSVQGKGEYRIKVDKQIGPLEDSAEKILGIGETSVRLAMVEGVNGVIEREVYSRVASREQRYLVGEHIPARLLDGGKRLWGIRVELWGELIRGLVDNYIDIMFVRAPKASSQSSV